MERGLMSFLRTPWVARPLAFLLSAAVCWAPVSAALAQHLTDPISDAAAHGQNAGQAFVPPPDIATADSQGNITLYPNSAEPQTIPAGELFPGATGDFSAYSGVYGNDAAMQTLGTDTQAILETQPSYPGEAYRTIIDSRLLSVPDMRSDPVWAQTDATLNNLATLAPEFSDCTATTTTSSGTRQIPVPDYRTCERVADSSTSCTVFHSYTANLIQHVGGPFNIQSCGPGCIDLWIGRMGDNYWSGWCSVFEDSVTINVQNPDAITSAVIDWATWDDWMQIWLGEELTWCGPDNSRITMARVLLNGQSYTASGYGCSPDTQYGGEICQFSVPSANGWQSDRYTVYTGRGFYVYEMWDPEGYQWNYANLVSFSAETYQTCPFPPETPGYACELSRSWVMNPGVDVTQYFRQGGLVTFRVRVSVAGGGEGYAHIRLNYDPAKTIIEDTWSGLTPECQAALAGISDGMCSSSIACALQPPATNRCVEINGVQVCEQHLQPSPVPGISSLCQRAEISANCRGFYTGPMECWTDINGVLRCPQNNGSVLDTCTPYRDDPNCGYISSRCLGPEGQSGTCYVVEETWDCGTTTEVPTATTSTTYDCSGPIRCMGTECVTPAAEQNEDFTRAMAALHTAQFMSMDGSCTDSAGGTQNVICTLFAGEAYQCKKAVGGIVNCCTTPDGVSLADYINLIYKLNDAGAFETAADWLSGSPLRGAWETLRDPIVNSWSSVKDWFASAWNNLSGSTTAAATEQAASFSLEQFKQQMMEATYEWVNQLFGPDAANALFTNTGGSVALNESVGATLQWITTAYMIYTIAILLINIIWECEEREFELGAKRELRLCTHVGSYCASRVLGSCIEKRESYCCFSSPLSRIIQQQVRPRLGMTWGSAENPSCNGLLLEQIGQVDWTTVNLDEWIGILNLAGKLPNAGNLNLDRVTGSGNTLNIDGNRPDAQTRAAQRIDGIDTTGARIDAGQQLR